MKEFIKRMKYRYRVFKYGETLCRCAGAYRDLSNFKGHNINASYELFEILKGMADYIEKGGSKQAFKDYGKFFGRNSNIMIEAAVNAGYQKNGRKWEYKPVRAM